ncbi:hypothetical protein HYFRA_00007043 [Hymenoscyphus fraxineus]|uniref:Uncharacterized protein n=1 Tax=Hymenoscyphus fraxineus TaxID=746836 RepID=A0A9N9KX07_9HELO|nr:hypothetical protein HYFRA_00007043 [Hymenoscyphus fraxineus]
MSTSTNQTKFIGTLADEIILVIVEWIDLDIKDWRKKKNPPCHITERAAQAILNLSQCSRHINSLVQPFLYRRFVDNDGTRLVNLMVRILAVPSRAHYVKYFCYHCDQYGRPVPAITPNDLEHLEKVVSKAASSPEDASEWTRSIQAGRWDAHAGLVLSQLLNLEKLEISAILKGVLTMNWVPKVFERAISVQGNQKTMSSPQPFSKLRSVSLVSPHGGHTSFSLRDIVPFLNVPSLRTFKADKLIDSFEFDWEKCTAGFSISKLRLSWIKPSLFARLLRQIRALKQLTLFADQGGMQQDTESFMQDLRSQRATLETLDLQEPSNRFSPFNIRTLTDFPNLKSLTIHISLLASHPAFPRSLQSLTVESTEEKNLKLLKTILQSKDLHTPSLKSLDLRWGRTKYPDGRPSPEHPDFHAGFKPSRMRDLWEMCRAVDVEMKLADEPPRFKFVSWDRPARPEGVRWPVVWMDGGTVIVRFGYPWVGFEECCRERGYDPESYDAGKVPSGAMQ